MSSQRRSLRSRLGSNLKISTSDSLRKEVSKFNTYIFLDDKKEDLA